MKELSIEEKARRYDEAIKRAQAKMEEAKVFDYDDEQTAHTIRLTTTDILPELAESDDERIRKEMIFYFQEEIPQCSIQEHAYKMREFISWLKRQEVERTKLELKAGNSYFCYKSRWERADSETFKKGLIYKCNKDGVLDNFVIKNPEQHFIEIKDERIAWLEKQGEQKPYGQREECLDCQMNYVGECKGSCAMKRDEQKPADTEKGAKGNEREIPNSAWSEEDETTINNLVWAISNDCIRPQDREDYCDWLKSLRPQNHWKPSDEQMNALNYVVNLMASSERPTENDLYYNILKSLRQQLNKLK